MEWVLLCLLVPAIVVPVVLLWGFAGCKFEPRVGLAKPVNLRATSATTTVISLAWDDPNADPVTFSIERTKEGGMLPQILQSSTPTFDDIGLDEGANYFYQVRAIRTSDHEVSELSDRLTARTVGVAFEAALTTDQPGIEGFCIVQRIEPARLRHSGTSVTITLRGSTTGNLTLDKVFISQPATSGDPYDSGLDLTPVAVNVTVPAGVAVTLPTIAYNLDRTRPLLVAFDINASSGNVRFAPNVPAGEAAMFFRPGTSEAAVMDRAPSVSDPTASPYPPSASIYLVERIEVL